LLYLPVFKDAEKLQERIPVNKHPLIVNIKTYIKIKYGTLPAAERNLLLILGRLSFMKEAFSMQKSTLIPYSFFSTRTDFSGYRPF